MSTVLPDWHLKSRDGIEHYEYSPGPKLLLAFLTRRGGVSRDEYDSLNLSFDVGDKTYHVEENYARTRRALRLPMILTVKQKHSDTVLPIAYEQTPSELLEGDACFTDRAGLGLGIKVADCLPVYIYAVDSACVGIAHCGWRGTAARIADKTARLMSRRFSIPLPDLRFALGPCVCPNCYYVGDDVRDRFSETFPARDKFFAPVAPNRGHVKYSLDIRAANRWLLKEMGLTETRSLGLCTRETANLFYSARRGKTTGRNLAVIALRSSPVA
jgi:YfiH family protein